MLIRRTKTSTLTPEQNAAEIAALQAKLNPVHACKESCSCAAKDMPEVARYKEIGAEWIKEDMHRIYFNDLADIYSKAIGLEIETYSKGGIKKATLKGEKISNNQAFKMLQGFAQAKVYFDMKDGNFHAAGLSEEKASMIFEEIKKS